MSLKKNQLLVIKVLFAFDIFAVSLLVPLLSTYFRAAGVTSTSYGLISSLYSASQIVGGLIIGILSDSLSKKDILLMSFIGSAISYGIVGLSKNYGALLGSRIIVGLVKQTMTVSTIVIAELTGTDHSSRTYELGYLSAISTASFIIGPSIGGILYKIDIRLPALIAVLCFIVNILLCLIFLPHDFCQTQRSSIRSKSNETTQNEKNNFLCSLRQLVQIPGVWQIFACRLIVSFVESSMSSRNILNYYEDRFHIATHQRGFISSASSIVVLLAQTVIVGFAHRLWGDDVTVLIAAIGLVMSSVVEGLLSSMWQYLLFVQLPANIASCLIGSATRSQFSSLVPREHAGKAIGVMNVLSSGVGVISPLYGSFVYNKFGGASGKALVASAHYAFLALVLGRLGSQSKMHPHVD